MAMQWHMEALFMISAVMEALFMISAVMIQAPKLQLVSHVVSPNFHKKKQSRNCYIGLHSDEVMIMHK